jgi:hypothetical protein
MAPTIIDKTIHRFSKPLLITFTSVVVISAAITIFSPGLITGHGGLCCNKSRRRRRAKSIQYPEFEGEPRDWTNEQLLQWLEAVCIRLFFAFLHKLNLDVHAGFVFYSVLVACLIDRKSVYCLCVSDKKSVYCRCMSAFFFWVVRIRTATCRSGLTRDETIWDLRMPSSLTGALLCDRFTNLFFFFFFGCWFRATFIHRQVFPERSLLSWLRAYHLGRRSTTNRNSSSSIDDDDHLIILQNLRYDLPWQF